jgi:hypothetical protein
MKFTESETFYRRHETLLEPVWWDYKQLEAIIA